MQVGSTRLFFQVDEDVSRKIAHNYDSDSQNIQSCHSQNFSFKQLYFLPGYSACPT